MADPMGDVIAGAFNIGGGLLGAAQNRQSQRAGYDFQREVLKNSIQWRMADARAAGVHPLAAMGMMPAASSPVVLGETMSDSMAKAGQSFGRAVSSEDKSMEIAQVELLNAQKKNTEMETQIKAAELAKMTQTPTTGIMPESGGVLQGMGQAPEVPAGNSGTHVMDLKAPPIMDSSERGSHVQAGVIPGWSTMRIHPDMHFRLPAGEGQEAHWEQWSELSPLEKFLTMMHNEQYYGPGYAADWLKTMAGGQPSRSYTRPFVGPTLPFMNKPHIASDALGDAGRKFLDWSKAQGRRYLGKSQKDFLNEMEKSYKNRRK